MSGAAPDRRFLIRGPAIVSVSGGRTSAYMLHRILEAHGGQLPSDVHAVFANTGREMPATLDFIQACGTHWGVHIHWVEYRRDPETGRTWAEPVSHNSASRRGEPFRQLLEAKGWLLPFPKGRFCTTELKVRPIRNLAQQTFGFSKWRSVVGLRADEMHRVARAGMRNAAKKDPFFVSCPLAKARITKAEHVSPFWRAQPFDLGLAGDWEGNCDGCFLKRISAIRRMTINHPDRMAEWALDEAVSKARGYTNGRYRIDRPGYAEIAEQVRTNPRLPLLDPDDRGDDVMADCEGGCGV